MEIESIEPVVVGVPEPHKGGVNWVFVKVTADDGRVGWGEASGASQNPRTVATAVEELAPHALGTSPFDVERLRGALYEGQHFFHVPGPVGAAALAAIETACYDLAGQAAGVPVYDLLGGQVNETLRTYTYIHYRWDPPESPEDAADAAESYVDEGFTGLKLDPIRPIAGPREVPGEELDYAEEVVAHVREAVGPGVDILLGTHGQLHTQEAIRLAKRVEASDPLWLEEPVPPERADEMARVSAATSIPVATGERIPTLHGFSELIETGAADILQVNVGMLGLSAAKKVAAVAEAHYRQIAPWMYCGPIHGAAALHLDAASRNFLIQESIEDWSDSLHNELLTESIGWHEGFIEPPEGPGLGVALDESVLDDYPPNDPTGPHAPLPRAPHERFGRPR